MFYVAHFVKSPEGMCPKDRQTQLMFSLYRCVCVPFVHHICTVLVLTWSSGFRESVLCRFLLSSHTVVVIIAMTYRLACIFTMISRVNKSYEIDWTLQFSR